MFAQLCDQFMLRRNYANTIFGLSVRILSKTTAVILLQYINSKNGKSLNHLICVGILTAQHVSNIPILDFIPFQLSAGLQRTDALNLCKL